MQDSKFSFLGSHGGPGARFALHRPATQNIVPARCQSLPHLGIPAGHSLHLGNSLAHKTYASLGARYVARLDVSMPSVTTPLRPSQPAPVRKSEEWAMPDRIRPEHQPPAGVKKERQRGKRLIDDNANNCSNVDMLVFGRDLDGSAGPRENAAMPASARAGVNAQRARLPPWGELPPTCHRTFGTTQTDDWEAVTYERKDAASQRPFQA